VPGKPLSRILTPVVQDKLDPIWNCTQQVLDWEPGDSLSLAVMDKDFGNRDDLLGRVTLPAEKCYPFTFEGELPLKDSGTGRGKGTTATLTIKVTTEEPAAA